MSHDNQATPIRFFLMKYAHPIGDGSGFCPHFMAQCPNCKQNCRNKGESGAENSIQTDAVFVFTET